MSRLKEGIERGKLFLKENSASTNLRVTISGVTSLVLVQVNFSLGFDFFFNKNLPSVKRFFPTL